MGLQRLTFTSSSLSGLNNQPWSWTHPSSECVCRGSVEVSRDILTKLSLVSVVHWSLLDWFFPFKFFVKASYMFLSDAHGLSTACFQGHWTTSSMRDSTLACHSCRCVCVLSFPLSTIFVKEIDFVEQNYEVFSLLFQIFLNVTFDSRYYPKQIWKLFLTFWGLLTQSQLHDLKCSIWSKQSI